MDYLRRFAHSWLLQKHDGVWMIIHLMQAEETVSMSYHAILPDIWQNEYTFSDN